MSGELAGWSEIFNDFQHFLLIHPVNFLNFSLLFLLTVIGVLWLMVHPSVLNAYDILTISVNISSLQLMFRKLRSLDSELTLLFPKHPFELILFEAEECFFMGAEFVHGF